ncbi:SdrD B-like domain-containing protein [Nonomuraea sp. NPDC050556]|uniref:SdrD B-like domain-containing protein n=1 Tax=Nonomuraea sp. NPDC050556 TaxID=3364369 RepID=UPI0037B9BCDD
MGRSVRKGLGAVTAVAAGLAGMAVIAAPAQADDGAVSVTVVRDNDSDGSYTAAREPGVAGITVKLYDDTGAVASATTDAQGAAAFSPATAGLTGGRYRVEATIPSGMPYLKPAPAYGPAPSLSPLTSFVDVSGGQAAAVTIGVHNPADYVQADPMLASPLHRGFNNDQQKEVDPALSAVVSWPFDRTGDRNSARPDLRANQGDVGTTYGLAWQRQSKLLFTSAMAKRHTKYGPLGSGGIYVVDAGGKASGFAKLANAGSTEHGQNGMLHDSAFYDVPGKQGLGDLDLSEDEKTLYAVNLATRQLLTFDVAKVDPGTMKEPATTTAIPDPGCPNPGDWRPWALGVQDGKVYVGGVCSGQSTQSKADLAVHILTFNPATKTFRKVFSHRLDYVRGMAWTDAASKGEWNPWQGAWDPSKWQGNVGGPAYPQPILTDLEFDRGSLLLGFRDRFGDQLGSQALGVDANDGQNREPTSAAGDIKRACWNGKGWDFEGEGACPNHYDGTFGGNQPPGTVEYYPNEEFFDGGGHQEMAAGALANGPRFGEVMTTIVDPWYGEVWANGVRAFDNNTGRVNRKPYTVGSWYNDRTLFGKANGLGDLEFLAAPAPVQIGDRVWFDADADGVQDAREDGVGGVEVALACDDDTARITTTGADGSYAFNNVPAETACTLTFDASDAAGLPEGVSSDDLKLTKRGAGAANTDSNADPASGVATVTVGAAGANDHTIDVGYTAGATTSEPPVVTPPVVTPPVVTPPVVTPPVVTPPVVTPPVVTPPVVAPKPYDNRPPTAPRPSEATVAGAVGTPITGQLTSEDPEGGKVTFEVSSGSLPPGVSLGKDGKITGTPTEAGQFRPTIKACDAYGQCSSTVVTFSICGSCAPAPDPDETAGSVYRRK